jgi:hypothetical protein
MMTARANDHAFDVVPYTPGSESGRLAADRARFHARVGPGWATSRRS